MQNFEIPSEEIVAWRRHFHENPELSFKEVATSQYIVDELGKMAGIDAIERPTETSVVAIIKGGKGAGKTIALRADIDALPVAEANEVCYRSKVEGLSHACGHDGHAAMLLGTAKVLGAMKDQFAGTVKLMFQPAEEMPPGGAIEMIKAGVLEGVDYCMGLHIVNDKAGLVRMIESEAATTSTDAGFITITGRGSHGSMPHASIDPIVVGAEIVMALHTIVARNICPDNFAVVSPAVFKSGTVCNVIPHTAEIHVNCRTKNEKDREYVIERINTIAQNIAAANGAQVEVKWMRGYSAVAQDLDLVKQVKEAMVETFGADNVATSKGLTASEDFSEFTKVVPSCYFTIGGGNAEEGFPYMNHHPQFNFDEKCLTVGTKAEVAAVMKLLG
jgi:amidohydrolase